MKTFVFAATAALKRYPYFVLLIVVAFFVHMISIMPSGSRYCYQDKCGVYFWSAHEHDAIWHLALVENAFTTWPPQNPVFAGVPLTSYNWGIDFIIWLLTFTGIPPAIWYFKIIPLLWFIGYTWAVIVFARHFVKTTWGLWVALFFAYFATSLSPIFALYKGKQIWELASAFSPPASIALVNIQYAISLPFFILLLSTLLGYAKKGSMMHALGIGAYVFILFMLKIYAGILAVAAIAALGGYLLFKKRLGEAASLAVCALISVATAYLILRSPTGNSFPFIWQPLGLLWPMIENAEGFYNQNLSLMRYALEDAGGFSGRLLLMQVFLIVVFIVFHFGLRLIGIYSFIRAIWSRNNVLHLLLMVVITISILCTILLLQRGVWWNTIQFFYYGLFFMGFYAAATIENMSKKHLGQAIAVFILVFLFIPNISIIKLFTHFPPTSYIPDEELEVLRVLAREQRGIVLTPYVPGIQTPFPVALNGYLDTAYVSAYGKQVSYVANETQLRLLQLDYHERQDRVARRDCSLLGRVDYLYVLQRPSHGEWEGCAVSYGWELVYKNKAAALYKKPSSPK